jgi:cell division protein FtsB
MSRVSALRIPSLSWLGHWPVLLLVGLILLIQYPLWLGKGGWLRVADLDSKLKVQVAVNQKLTARNAALSGEVADLKNGLRAIEERARNELDLIKPDELFVNIVGSKAPTALPEAEQVTP